jgi:hypothetical protein
MSDFLLANHVAGTIYNPVNGDRVQFSKLPADPNLNGYLPESLEQTYLNTKAQAAKRHTVRLSGTDISEGKIGLLEEWRDAETPVQIAIAGDLNTMWEEPVPITDLLTYKPRISEGNQAFGVELTVEGRNKKVWYVENLLSRFKWQDLDGDGVADGYTLSADVTDEDFVDNEQLYTVGGNRTLSRQIVFPINGIAITVSVLISTLRSNIGVRIINRNFAGGSLISAEAIATGATVVSQKTTTEADGYILQPEFGSIQSASTAELGFKFPALTTNGKLTPGTSFLTP